MNAIRFRQDHLSGRYDRSVALMRSDLARSHRSGAWIITGTEADVRAQKGKRQAEAREFAERFDFNLTLGNRDSNNDCYIMTREDRLTYVEGGTVPVRSYQRPEPPDAAWQVVTDKATGKRIIISAFHAPHGVEILGRFRPGKKSKQWKTEIHNWRLAVERLAEEYDADATLFTGDWNINLAAKNPQIRNWLAEEFKGYDLPSARPATHGKRAIDFTISKGLTRYGVEAYARTQASDHRGIKNVFGWPTTKPKEPTMKSQNGWPARKGLPTRPLVVAGESFAPGVLDNDDVYTVLMYVAQQMHKRVEPIVKANWHQADDWGYHFRPNRNDPNDLSNHSSGTAIDYNATRHPNRKRGTFTKAQEREIRKILDEVDNVVRWGGDYEKTADEMHFEINVSPAELAVVARRLRQSPKGDWFNMASKEDLKAAIREVLNEPLVRVPESDRGAFSGNPKKVSILNALTRHWNLGKLDLRVDQQNLAIDKEVGEWSGE